MLDFLKRPKLKKTYVGKNETQRQQNRNEKSSPLDWDFKQTVKTNDESKEYYKNRIYKSVFDSNRRTESIESERSPRA